MTNPTPHGQVPEALRLADEISKAGAFPAYPRAPYDAAAAELRRQHARIAELEAQLESIGAGGVSGPLIGQPQARPISGAKSFQTYAEANAYSKGYYAGKKAAKQAQAGAVPLTCEWAHNENDGFWESACGEAWRFDDGGPAENSMHFCHSCGKSLRIKGKDAGNADA